MNQEVLIDVQHLTRHYGRHTAVGDIGFQVRRGEVLGFLGPNGAGKSTTMNLLCGVLAPHGGRIRIDSLDLQKQARQARARIGYLPEKPPLYPELTVREYLYYCARLHGLGRADARRALRDACQRCGLGEVAGRLIAHLSKGYQQRVGIAQAIVHSPEVVILDEPTVGLDPIQIREIRALIRELGEDHSVILSTHILPEVQAVCSRVLMIHQGRLVLDQSLRELSGARPTCLQVALHAPPPLSALATLDGVLRVDQAAADSFLLHHDPADQALAERVAAHAVRENWRLYGLRAYQPSLEETFIRLTCGDGTPAHAPCEAPRT